MIKRDRFELLSAYLDGEVTPHERQLVNSWLAHDPTAKCLYNRLLCLRQGLKSSPIEPIYTVDETLSGVFTGLNRRFQKTCMAGAGVLAIGVLGFLSGVFSPQQMLQQAAAPSSAADDSEVLKIALDKPAFPIPGASTDMLGASQGAGASPTPSSEF